MSATLASQLADISATIAANKREAAKAIGLKFDLSVFIEDELHDVGFKQRLMATAVWSLDTQLVNAAARLYYQLRDETPDAKTIGEVIDAFVGTYSEESYWGDGYAKLIVNLLTLQPQWHDSATRYAISTGYDSYAPKTIDQLMLPDIKGKELVGSKQRANIEVMATFASLETKADREQLLADLLQQAATRTQQLDEQRRKLAPAVNAIIDQARRFVPHDDIGDFVALPTLTRMSIMRTVAGQIDRAAADLSKRLETQQYMYVMIDAYKARPVFMKVIDDLAREILRERPEA